MVTPLRSYFIIDGRPSPSLKNMFALMGVLKRSLSLTPTLFSPIPELSGSGRASSTVLPSTSAKALTDARNGVPAGRRPPLRFLPPPFPPSE